MVTCQIAHSVFEVPRKIARLRSQSYLDAIYSDLYRRDHLPIDVVISPEKEVAEAALQRLATPSTFDTESFLDGKGQLLGLTISDDCPVIYTPLNQLSDLFSTLKVIVVSVYRNGQRFVPSPGDQLFPGDAIHVFTDSSDINRTVEVFGKKQGKQDRVVIIGGGNVGLSVAQNLERRTKRIRSRVIEANRARAEFAADALERTIVLNGDGLDPLLLQEARVEQADAVLCVTDDDKTNMLASVRAKQMGCQMSICLINDPSLSPLMAPMGIDAYINPRATTVSSILKYVRHGRVRTVYSIGDGDAEMIEAQILGTSPMAGQAIRDLDLPEGVIIGGLVKGGKTVKLKGSVRLDEGDIIAIFALKEQVPHVENLLQVSIDFF